MNEFQLQEIGEEDTEEWDSFMRNSPHGTFFHHYRFLQMAEKESGYQLLPLAISKEGYGRVCQFPVFIKKLMQVRVAVSPPPGCGIPNLGPAFKFSSGNQRVIESEQRHVVLALCRYLEKLSIDYYRFACTPEVCDIRPFKWSGFKTSVNYTYRMRLCNLQRENISAHFDQKVRKMIRRFERNYPEASVREMAPDQILERIKSRYQSKNRKNGLSISYFNDIMSEYPMAVQPVGVFYQGEFIAGTILLKNKNLVQAWIGGFSTAPNYNGSNEFLRKEVIGQALKGGYSEYESVGANTLELCDNKAKYNYCPIPYYVLEKRNLKAFLAQSIAQKLGLHGSDF